MSSGTGSIFGPKVGVETANGGNGGRTGGRKSKKPRLHQVNGGNGGYGGRNIRAGKWGGVATCIRGHFCPRSPRSPRLRLGMPTICRPLPPSSPRSPRRQVRGLLFLGQAMICTFGPDENRRCTVWGREVLSAHTKNVVFACFRVEVCSKRDNGALGPFSHFFLTPAPPRTMMRGSAGDDMIAIPTTTESTWAAYVAATRALSAATIAEDEQHDRCSCYYGRCDRCRAATRRYDLAWDAYRSAELAHLAAL